MSSSMNSPMTKPRPGQFRSHRIKSAVLFGFLALIVAYFLCGALGINGAIWLVIGVVALVAGLSWGWKRPRALTKDMADFRQQDAIYADAIDIEARKAHLRYEDEEDRRWTRARNEVDGGY